MLSILRTKSTLKTILRAMCSVVNVNPLKPSGKLHATAALTTSTVSSALSIYGFCMILGENRDYLLKQG